MKILPLNLPGSIYASPMPYSGCCDPFHRLFDEYGYHDIHTVVMLASEEESLYNTGRNLRQFYPQNGLNVIYLPIEDYSTPDMNALSKAVDAAIATAQAGRNIAIHCHYGKGRTGTFSACLARRVLGLDGDAALAWVRSHIRGAVETLEQEAMVRNFEEKE
jgi:protein-tyrosine phosphatase